MYILYLLFYAANLQVFFVPVFMRINNGAHTLCLKTHASSKFIFQFINLPNSCRGERFVGETKKSDVLRGVGIFLNDLLAQ